MHLNDLDEYLASSLGETLSDKNVVTELNEILLNSIPDGWHKQSYVQGFDCDNASFKKSVNMFEHTEIAESIYESVVEPPYNKPTWEDSNCAGRIRNN